MCLIYVGFNGGREIKRTLSKSFWANNYTTTVGYNLLPFPIKITILIKALRYVQCCISHRYGSYVDIKVETKPVILLFYDHVLNEIIIELWEKRTLKYLVKEILF